MPVLGSKDWLSTEVHTDLEAGYLHADPVSGFLRRWGN